MVGRTSKAPGPSTPIVPAASPGRVQGRGFFTRSDSRPAWVREHRPGGKRTTPVRDRGRPATSEECLFRIFGVPALLVVPSLQRPGDELGDVEAAVNRREEPRP